MDLNWAIIDELKRSGVAKVEKYVPFFNASIGAHMLNIRNWEKTFLYEGRIPYDFRANVFFVAPSGFSKSFFQMQFLMPVVGILEHSKIDHKFEGYMTEAGWVGTIKTVNGESITIPGEAILHREAILGCEEFSAITQAMKAQYSKQLDTAMLTSLDRGFISKRLGPGGIEDHTCASLWAGTQPARFDLSQGLGRRFVFLTFLPTKEDIETLKYARRRMLNKICSFTALRVLGKEINQRHSAVKKIESISFDDKIYKEFDKYGLLHYEEPLYERIIAGYQIMREEPEKDLVVALDDDSRKLIRKEYYWRQEVMRGTQYAQIVTILKQATNQSMHMSKLRDKMLVFGYDWVSSTSLIMDLVRSHVLFMKSGVVSLGRREKKK